jgi:DedD protein
MSDTPEMQLQLKKRARRRLVGAVAVAGLAAVVLPMVMDEEPKQQIPDVQIRIPGQNQTSFGLGPARGGAGSDSVLADASGGKAADNAQVKTVEPPADKPAAEKASAKGAERAGEKAAEAANGAAEHKGEARSEHKSEKPAEKPADKPPAKPAEKAAEKPAKASESAQNGQYLILIGAFANPGNVKVLQTKIGELGIKVITEPLDSPDGKRTRVRAGPFPSREAAEKALEKLRRIGVNGVVAAKQ